jgi:hypothetical protein
VSFAYAMETMSEAIIELATGTGSIQERLEKAWSQFIRAPRAVLPDHLQAEYDLVMETIRSGSPDEDKGAIATTARAMTAEEAKAAAGQLLVFYWNMTRHYRRP